MHGKTTNGAHVAPFAFSTTRHAKRCLVSGFGRIVLCGCGAFC
jgi:hypothetical protein